MQQSINRGRVILGGLAAGTVMNVIDFLGNDVMLRGRWQMAATILNPGIATAMQAQKAQMGLIVLEYILGFVLIWMFAAMRPRYGAGPRTAAVAALMMWVVLMTFWLSTRLMHMFPASLVLLSGGVALAEFFLGAMLGGWIYKENSLHMGPGR